jgi:hypothetical protein
LTLNLNREIEQLRSEGRWQSGHTARTLAKYSDFRVVLIVSLREPDLNLRSSVTSCGIVISQEHAAPGRSSLRDRLPKEQMVIWRQDFSLNHSAQNQMFLR